MILYLEWTKRSSSTGQPDRRHCPATSYHLVPTYVSMCAFLCCCRCVGKFAGPGPRCVAAFAGADGPLPVGSKLWFGSSLQLVNLSFHIGDLVWRFGLVRGFVAWSAPPTNATQFDIYARFQVLIPFGAKSSNLDFIFRQFSLITFRVVTTTATPPHAYFVACGSSSMFRKGVATPSVALEQNPFSLSGLEFILRFDSYHDVRRSQCFAR